MTKTLEHGYLSDSTQQELSNEYKHDRFWMVSKKSLNPCTLYESNLGIERVKPKPND